MARIAVCVFLLALCGASVFADTLPPETEAESDKTCTSATKNIATNWIDMQNHCEEAVRKQISMEVEASYFYLAIAAHFSKDEINLPGFANLFFGHASEEREHAEGLIEYMLMRGPQGVKDNYVKDLIKIRYPGDLKIQNGMHALKEALAKEKAVTESIKNVISECDRVAVEGAKSDYHLSDHLTGVYLEEQYKGMRDLAGKISTLGKMMDASGALGQFLFDKELMA